MVRSNPRTPWRSSTLALAALLWTGCGTAAADPDWAVRPARLAEATAFQDHGGALHGLDTPAPASRFTVGDRMLLGVAFRDGGTERRWLVRIEVVDPEHESYVGWQGHTFHRLLLRVAVADGNGEPLGEDLVSVTRSGFEHGLIPAVRGIGDVVSESDGEQAQRTRGAFGTARMALRDMLRVVRGSAVLSDVLWEVIDLPSLWSVLIHFGVQLRGRFEFDEGGPAAPFAIAGQELPTFEFPAEVLLNDTPALRAKILVTDPDSPLNISAGIVGIDAFQPSNPAARVSIRLLAARRADD